MVMEIERKFLVDRDMWKPCGEGTRIAQGYLCTEADRTVRVRVKGAYGYLTVKGRNEGISRQEFEYEIPIEDAEAMLGMCKPTIIEKVRYHESLGAHLWEIDVFSGENDGLVLAEIELQHEDESFERPEWLGEEVSMDHRYYNSSLSNKPYRKW